MFGFFWQRPSGRANALYRQVVGAARQPVFYDRFGVADTPEGRLELLMLHTGLVVSRLSDRGGDRTLARDLSEAFFTDMDATLREMGTSDVGVPKKMKKLASAFYGRLQAYGRSMDEAELAAALRRNVHGGDEHPATAALARYLIAARTALRDADAEKVATGRVPMPDPAGFLDEESSK